MKPFTALCLSLAVATFALGAEGNSSSGWSADLLQKILRSDAPASRPERPDPQGEATGEMLLRSYHLSHLRVGEAGRAQNAIALLTKLLPAGSSLNPDVSANSLHILTTPAAHKAVWDYLSAVDVADATPATPVIPEEVKAALKKLNETSEQSARLAGSVDALKTGVAASLAAIDARQRQQVVQLVTLGVLGFGGLAVVLAWMLRRRRSAPSEEAGSDRALVLAPDQLANALSPGQDRMRTEMLGLLNEVAIKLQAQHNEQQKLVHTQQLQFEAARSALVEERKQFIAETGTMVVQAVERVDATTAKLAQQQDKVAELVEELQTTVRELDETKDHLRTREVELEHERAKIAALSLLLEDGSLPPAADPATPGEQHETFNGNHRNGVALTSAARITTHPCTTPKANPAADATPPLTPRYQFLPPHHPES